MSKKSAIITGIVIALAVIALIVFNRLTSKKYQDTLFVEALKGDFEISISAAGELLAERSTDIFGPEIVQQGRDIRANNLRIQDLVPEGTEVKEGDYIAQLDRTEFENTLKDERERLATNLNTLEMRILDTAVQLTALRDEIRNQRHAVEEAEITLKNSKYEPPTTIRQAEIDLDKQQRLLEQKERSYVLRVAQAENQIRNQRLIVSRLERRVKDYEEVLAGFTVRAPAAGMVTYKKDRRGTKIKTGSTINPFERVIATLPDLSSMLSKIYVSEIEISKVKPGQEVQIKVDAFPEKAYKGVVLSAANIGEKLPNSDSKVFEVMIKLEGSDFTLRPSMTTDNKIIVKTIKDVVYIPAECVHTNPDGIHFVYTKNHTKQVVIPGDANDKNIVIEKGLKPGTQVYLVTPEDGDTFRLTGKDILESAE
ncbi:MAG: efflux RND transporter periplasmic adaptor subunit [Bacteroidales bacterium]|nr:efflux RND transporter periplasmic adaptor subunit [Bacteroidales bacterium]